jgi:hypothetical protein
MSMTTQTIIGAAALIAALNVAVDAVLPTPRPIEVHSLTFDGQTVTQDRTVIGTGDAFYMAWAATIIDFDTGASVPHCSGDGAFAYATGRHVVEMDLPHWTGREGCTPDTLEPGDYVARATWSWGDQQKTADSAPFTIP